MADTQAASIAAVREGIEATNRGDLESVVAGLDPEFEFHIAPGLGNAGTYMFEIRNGRLFRFHVLPSYEAALSAASEGERRRERAP